MLCTDGGVTWKYRWKSASAGARRFSLVYATMNARNCPCNFVNGRVNCPVL